MAVTGDKIAFGDVWCVSDTGAADIASTTVETSSVSVQLIAVVATGNQATSTTRFRVASATGEVVVDGIIYIAGDIKTVFNPPFPTLKGLVLSNPIFGAGTTSYSVLYRKR